MLSVGLIERESFADPWGPREFESALSAPQTIFLIAEDADGVVAGYAIALAVADEAEILNLAVHPKFRGKGIGRSLLDSAVDQVKSRGAEQVYLEVRESNDAARKLYSAKGFDVITRRPRYYQHPVEDALVLRLGMQR